MNRYKIIINNFLKNKSSTIASILSTTVTLVIFATILTLFLNVRATTNSIEDQLSLKVLVNQSIDSKTDPRVTKIVDDIKKNSEVESVAVLGKEEEFDKIVNNEDQATKDTFKGYREVPQNPLSIGIYVKVKSGDMLAPLSQKIKSIQNVQEVTYLEETVSNLLRFLNIVNIIAIALIIILSITTIFLISNVITLSINLRKEEIEIMRLVGASNRYIKSPLITEGIIIGIFSSILAIIVASLGYNAIYNGSKTSLGSIIKFIEPSQIILIISLATILLSVLISYIGSKIAIRRYLKI